MNTSDEDRRAVDASTSPALKKFIEAKRELAMDTRSISSDEPIEPIYNSLQHDFEVACDRVRAGEFGSSARYQLYAFGILPDELLDEIA